MPLGDTKRSSQDAMSLRCENKSGAAVTESAGRARWKRGVLLQGQGKARQGAARLWPLGLWLTYRMPEHLMQGLGRSTRCHNTFSLHSHHQNDLPAVAAELLQAQPVENQTG